MKNQHHLGKETKSASGLLEISHCMFGGALNLKCGKQSLR